MQTPEQSSKEILPSALSEKEAPPISLEQPIIHTSGKENTSTRAQLPAKMVNQTSYSEEDILKGLVYPPPPSFYQNMHLPSEQPKTTRLVPPIHDVSALAQPPTNSPSPKTSSTTTLSTSTNRMGQPLSTTKQRPVKKSRRWIWVVASIMGLAFAISCSLCGWVVYGPISRTFQEAVDAQNTINAYYADLQARNYTHAYTYLALEGTQPMLTQKEFMQKALQQDSQSGPILTYTPNTPSFSTDPANPGTDISQSAATIQVGRKQKQYTVTLKLHHIGNHWKITEYSEL